MSNEWYTPAKYIEAARQVMGSIDLDPASCELANQTVRAARYYTEQENGLMLPWYGNVFCNPPYGRTYKGTGTAAFVARLIREYEKGNVRQAIIFTMVGMYASWFFRLLDYPHCFLEEKPLFCLPDGTITVHGFAACCTYLGANEQGFVEKFSQFGRIAKAIDVKVEKPRQLELVS